MPLSLSLSFFLSLCLCFSLPTPPCLQQQGAVLGGVTLNCGDCSYIIGVGGWALSLCINVLISVGTNSLCPFVCVKQHPLSVSTNQSDCLMWFYISECHVIKQVQYKPHTILHAHKVSYTCIHHTHTHTHCFSNSWWERKRYCALHQACCTAAVYTDLVLKKKNHASI